MTKLLDEIQSTEETWETTIYGGFDPDYTTSGIAMVHVHRSSQGRRRLSCLQLQEITVKKTKRNTPSNAMVRELYEHLPFFVVDTAVVEGQEVYADRRSTVAEIVAKANVMINLAHVSGAAASLYRRCGADVEIVRPKDWKAQRKKDPMHKAIKHLVQDQNPEIFIGEVVVWPANILTAGIHALDAAGMALRKAGWHV